MAFPPPKGGPPKSKPPGPGGPPGAGGPDAGNPDPMAGTGGPPPMQPPGGPPPGAGADPMAAMMGQLGPGLLPPPQAPPPSFPGGPDGMPFGSSMPGGDMDGDQMDLEGSPLLQQLMGSLGGGDEYATMPGESDHVFDGAGTDDPGMGLDQIIQLLAMAQMGVGGGPPEPMMDPSMGMGMPQRPRGGVPPGGSGAPQGPSNIGSMLGF